MADLQNPFTVFSSQHRPLSVLLSQRVRHLNDRINGLKTTRELDTFREDELDEVIAGITPEPPSLGGVRQARIDEPAWSSGLGSKERKQFIRRHFAVQILGDFEILGYWPDEVAGVEPVDSSNWPASGLELEDPSHYWTISPSGWDDARENKTWAAYTHLDLVDDERKRAAAGELDLVQIVEERLSRVRPIAEALAKQTDDFFQRLPKLAIARLDAIREDMAINESITASLVFPRAWEAAPPKLETTPTPEQRDSQAHQVQIPITPRLSPVTFDGLLRTIRVWADALERYPAAFVLLSEDRISDLLAATLNATLPGAQREVYSRGGKSDIFVRADIFDEGLGPAKVFIAESKWASADKVVSEAIDPQLFGYLTTHDTDAVLLLLFKQKNFEAARLARTKALRAMSSFRSEKPSRVANWPILQFEHEGRIVRVCVASVSLG